MAASQEGVQDPAAETPPATDAFVHALGEVLEHFSSASPTCETMDPSQLTLFDSVPACVFSMVLRVCLGDAF